MDLFVSYAQENINHKGRHDHVLSSTGSDHCQQFTRRDSDAIYLLLATEDFVELTRESLSLQTALAAYDINI